MTIKILNQDSELSSFPSTQSLFLLSSTSIEETKLDSTIILFRLQTENQLINLAEPYSYNLGFLKETFDRVEMSFKVEVVSEGYKIICTPKAPLNLDSLYCLYVTNRLSEKLIDIDKLNSKSSSNVSVKILKEAFINKVYNLKVLETSVLGNSRNLLKVNLDGVIQTVDIKQKPKLYVGDIEITLTDTVYVKDEEFNITLTNSPTINQDFQYTFKTVTSSSITPIEKESSSTSISNAEILSYYQSLNSNGVVQKITVTPKYLATNVFSIKLPEGYLLDSDSPDFISEVSVAFNNYLLSNMELSDNDLKYIVIPFLDDFENEFIFEVIYGEDTQVEKVLIDKSRLP